MYVLFVFHLQMYKASFMLDFVACESCDVINGTTTENAYRKSSKPQLLLDHRN